jgi:hypothetical protein
MIDIVECTLDKRADETVFIVKGTNNNETFECRIELRLDDPDNLDDLEFECLDGIDLGPNGLKLIEELAHEIAETECYQDVLEAFENET